MPARAFPHPTHPPTPTPAVWAFAKLSHYHGPLMHTMAAEATRRIDEFRWAVVGGWVGGGCVAALLLLPSPAELPGSLPSLRPRHPSRPTRSQQNLSNLAWAFSKLGHLDEALLTAVAGNAWVMLVPGSYARSYRRVWMLVLRW